MCAALTRSLACSAALSFCSFRFFFVSAGSRSFSAPTASATVFGSCVGMDAMHVNLPAPVDSAKGSSLASAIPISRALAAAPLLAPTARRSHRRTVPSEEPVTRLTGPPPGPPITGPRSASSTGNTIALTRAGCALVIVTAGLVGGALWS